MQHSRLRPFFGPLSRPLTWVQVRDASWARSAIDGASIFLPLGAMLLWILSLSHIPIREMNDLGLVSVLPASFFAAILLLTGSFCLALRQRPLRAGTIFLHVGALIFILYGTPALVEETARFEATWKHTGIVDYIMDRGKADPRVNAYFNWPGFFVLAAFVTQAAGYDSLIGVAAWAHVFFSFLYLAPLVMIFRSITRDQGLVWLGVWFFYLTNWVGQDYFAPQAFSYFLYLAILACLLTWSKTAPRQPSPLGPILRPVDRIFSPARRIVAYLTHHNETSVPSTPWQRMGVIAIVIAAFAAMVPSHQLTPAAAVFTVGALVILSRIRSVSLVILMVVMVVTWMSFMAVPYFHGHLETHLTSVGKVDQNINRSVAKRIKGSPEHMFVVRMRMAFTVAVGAVAAAGAIRRAWLGHRDLTVALLVGAPVLLVVVQGYGGEMLIRVYFFALPGLAFFAAGLFLTKPGSQAHWRTSIAIGLVSVAFVAGFLVTRYGNERMDYFTPQEVVAVEFVYNNAEPKSAIIAGAGSLPWKFRDPTMFKHGNIGSGLIQNDDLDSLAERMAASRAQGRESYVIITRSTKATADMFRGLGTGALDRYERSLMASNQFEIFFRNEDATVFVLAGQAKAAQPAWGLLP